MSDIVLFLTMILAAVLSSAAAGIVWQRRQTPGAIPLALLLLAVMAWNFTAGLKNLSPNPGILLSLARIEIIGANITATLFLIFILEYTRQRHLLTQRSLLVLWIIPVLVAVLALTNESHQTFWAAVRFNEISQRYELVPGGMYSLHIFYDYAIRIASSALILLAIVRYPANYRQQSTALFVGTAAIWIGYLPSLPVLPELDSAWRSSLNPIAYTASGLVIAWSILRYRLFDLIPIARETIIENLMDGIIVLDTSQRIVDANPQAYYLLQIKPGKNVLGMHIEEALKHLPEVIDALLDTDMPYQDVRISGPQDLSLELMLTPLFDRQGQLRGKMLTIHNISARVRSEEAMRQSEENLRAVFENAPFPIFVTTLSKRRILYINPAGLKLYQISRADIGKLRVDGFLPNFDPSSQITQQIIAQTPIDNLEVAIPIADNKTIYVATSVRQIVYNHEKALLFSQIDISERKKAEEELQKSRAELRNIFEHADAGIHLLGPSGEITFSNRRWAEMLGCEPEKLIGRNLSDFVVKSDIPYSRHLFESLIAGEIDRYQLEMRYRRKDESIFWGVLSAIPVLSEKGEIESIVNFVTDITEKKQTERALRETEKRFREILEKIYLFAIMLDTEGRITFCNEYLLNATKWRKHDVIGQNWFEMFLMRDITKSREDYTRAVELGTLVSRHENEIIASDNRRILVAWSNILLRDENGKITGSASIGEDITERRRAQQAELEERQFADALYNTAKAITSTLNFEEVLDRILQNIDLAVENDAANIALIENGYARFVRAKGYNKFNVSNEEVAKLRFSVRKVPNMRYIYQSKEPLYIPDTHRYQGWKDIPTSSWIRSYIGVPIIIKEKIVGLINVDSAIPGFFTDEHVERLKAFSAQAAIAIENTRLYTSSLHELDERKRAQASLRRANQKLKTQLEEIESLQAKLREQAIRDALTGLFNRRYLEETLPLEIELSKKKRTPLCLMILDIDRFKSVNDTYGHAVGDEALKMLGNLLKDEKPKRAIPCRYGGEEFVVILPGMGLEEAYQHAEQLRIDFSKREIHAEKTVFRATISIGIASLYVHGENMNTLLTSADYALYQAKESGRNCTKIAGQ